MSDFKQGDRVRLTDEAFEVLSKPATRAEAQAVLGVLTVSEVCVMPTNEDPAGQALWFEETTDTVPSECVRKI